MKLATALLVLATALPALEVRPATGLDLDPAPFDDLRVTLGVAAPVTEAAAGARSYETDPAYGPRLALQWVHGRSDEAWGWAFGLGLTYDDRRGYVSTATGVQPGFGTGDTLLRSVTVACEPKIVLRPDFDDPIDWPAGSMQIEMGPTFGVGAGWARIGGSPPSDTAGVVSWGARIDVLWTTASHAQIGLAVGYEAFTCTATVDHVSDASISGQGIVGGLILGKRL